MKALVVGGTGATGPCIIDGLLKRGYQVTMLHRGAHETELPPEVEHLHADPHWPENLKEALEGKSFDLVVSIYGRLRFIAEAIKGRTPRLISVGGALAVYKGWLRVTEPHPWYHMEESWVPVKEDDVLATAPGVDHFSERVREAEQVVMQAHQQGHYNATHFRYPIVYGPRHIGPGEWCIMRRIRDGRRQLIVPGGGMTLLSKGFAENIAHGIMLAVDNPTASAGQIYNVCDERVLSNREWIRLIERVMNHQFEFIEIPFDILPTGFHVAPTPTLFPYHRVMDITKIKQQLGYGDVVPTDRAIELTVNWYLENPLPPGGELEKNLGDPFDYAMEDKFIQIYSTAREQLRQQLQQVPGTEPVWRHPYAHPQKRGDLK
jgi:nucleoside-diphosphate-sugar epimerase